MSIGMAVNSGHLDEKRELVELLQDVAKMADAVGLWVNGEPAASHFLAISAAINRNIEQTEANATSK